MRTPSVVARWAVAEIVSQLVSGFMALGCFAIAAGGLLAVGMAFGPADRGQPTSLLTSMVGAASLGVLFVIYRAVRDQTRPESLPPPVALNSGRSSPLYDRELDGPI